MSFAVRSLVLNCQSQKIKPYSLVAADRIAFAADTVVATALIAISGLILEGGLNAPLLSGVGTISHSLAIAGIAVGGVVMISNLIAAVLRVINKRLPDYLSIIRETPQENPTIDQIRASRSEVSLILGELYLSDCLGFAGTTRLSCLAHNQKGIPYALDTSNSRGFQTVITVCCVCSMLGDFQLGGDSSTVKTSYDAQGITWFYVGKSIADDPSAWKALAHDATFPNSTLSQLEITAKGISEEELKASYAQKTTIMDSTPVTLWFEAIFAEMDKAAQGNKRVLVHCQAGVSRSASLIAAYLIRRFEVTTDEAINFLRSRRACIEPKFVEQLRTYERALRPDS